MIHLGRWSSHTGGFQRLRAITKYMLFGFGDRGGGGAEDDIIVAMSNFTHSEIASTESQRFLPFCT